MKEDTQTQDNDTLPADSKEEKIYCPKISKLMSILLG